MGVDVPDEVMVALSERRISLLSGELMLASVAVRNGTRELDSRGSPRARLLSENGPCTTCWHM